MQNKQTYSLFGFPDSSLIFSHRDPNSSSNTDEGATAGKLTANITIFFQKKNLFI